MNIGYMGIYKKYFKRKCFYIITSASALRKLNHYINIILYISYPFFILICLDVIYALCECSQDHCCYITMGPFWPP